MRLLCVEHKTVWGGGQVALVNLLCEWQRTNALIEPQIVCPPNAALAPRVRALNIPCETLDLGAIEKTRGSLWNAAQRLLPTARLISLLRRTRPDVVLANGAFSFLACVFAAKLLRVPVIWLEHNTTLPNDAMVRRMLAWASHIVVVSAAIQAQFLTLDPTVRAKISVIYNGIDPQKFSPDPRSRAALRQQFGWTETTPVVGTVSRLSPEKGIGYLLDAVPQILPRVPSAQFLIVGDGPIRAELAQRAAGLPVHFVGAQENVADWLNAMDLFVMPSLAEAFGIAVVEAMSCALPVVVSDVGGLREIVVADETGLRVPPQDPTRLATAIISLLHDLAIRRAFGQTARTRVQQHFTLEQQALSMLQILQFLTQITQLH